MFYPFRSACVESQSETVVPSAHVSFWKRTLQALGFGKADDGMYVSGDHLVFRDVSKAKALPQEPAQAGPQHMGICERCRAPLQKVVFTTAGSGQQAEVWKEYPLAMDGWSCNACGWSLAPRFITSEEAVEYARRGAEHRVAGEFDDAEFWVRRIIGSWPGYPAAYADLGHVIFARARASGDAEDRARYYHEAVRWLGRAIEADTVCTLPSVRVSFARSLAFSGDEARATDVLRSLLSMSEVPEKERSDADALLTEIKGGDALFVRATEYLGTTVFEPPAKPLPYAARSAVERGRALLEEAASRKTTFAALFLLGMAERRLQNLEAARAALEAALELEPNDPDGCRELSLTYLQLKRPAQALPLARRVVELQPGDAGLKCNLAIVLLLAGDVEAARAAATSALMLEPGNSITQHILQVIDDVDAGNRPRPRTLAELEGRPA